MTKRIEEAVALLERIARNPENVAHDSLLRDDLLRFLRQSSQSAEWWRLESSDFARGQEALAEMAAGRKD